MTMSSVCKDVG